jgi:pyruvate,orthophosphate dikinase
VIYDNQPARCTVYMFTTQELHASPAIVRSRLAALRQANPMLGLRGCRLGIVHPEISLMQVGGVGVR